MLDGPDPAQLIASLEADALALDEASKALQEIQDAYVRVAVDYQDEEDDRLREVEAEYEERNQKLPSERQRLAHARPRIDRDIRREWTRLEAQRKYISRWVDIRQAAISARQSELRALRAESEAPEPQWSRR